MSKIKVSFDNIQYYYKEEFLTMCKFAYEKCMRESIIDYIKINNMMHLENYKLIWLEYLNFYIEYEKYEKFFFENVVQILMPDVDSQNKIKWSVDYNKGRLLIYEK